MNTLTVDSLRRHDNLIGVSNTSQATGDNKSVSDNSVVENDAYSSFQGTTKTFDTFASDWTCCSNISFNKYETNVHYFITLLVHLINEFSLHYTNRLINRFDLSSAHHKEMLAVLAAVTEVIKANGGTENTTEYFAALVYIFAYV